MIFRVNSAWLLLLTGLEFVISNFDYSKYSGNYVKVWSVLGKIISSIVIGFLRLFYYCYGKYKSSDYYSLSLSSCSDFTDSSTFSISKWTYFLPRIEFLKVGLFLIGLLNILPYNFKLFSLLSSLDPPSKRYAAFGSFSNLNLKSSGLLFYSF